MTVEIGMAELEYKYIQRIGLFDCTDGEIHGGGKTKEEAYADYCGAIADEVEDRGAGWKTVAVYRGR